VKDQAMGVVMRNRNGWMWGSVLDELVEVHKKKAGLGSDIRLQADVYKVMKRACIEV
jgi:hypothetical protein